MREHQKTGSPHRIAFALDNAFTIPTVVAVYSLLRHWNVAKPMQLVFLTSGLTSVNRALLTGLVNRFSSDISTIFIDANSAVRDLPSVGHLTPTTYCRFFLPDFFPDVDELLYVDGDVCFLGDLSEAPSVDEFLARACVDNPTAPETVADALPYCRDELGEAAMLPLRNMGVLLMNARRWRELGVADKLVAFVHQHCNQLRLADQDAINAVCGGDIGDLPETWNWQVRSPTGLAADTKIVHYSGKHKPWNSGFTNPLVQLYLQESRAALKAAGLNYRAWAVRRFGRAAYAAIESRLARLTSSR